MMMKAKGLMSRNGNCTRKQKTDKWIGSDCGLLNLHELQTLGFTEEEDEEPMEVIEDEDADEEEQDQEQEEPEETTMPSEMMLLLL